MWFNKKPQLMQSKEFLQLKEEVDSQKLHLQQLERQLDFVKLQMKDLKTLVNRRLKIELEEEDKKEKNKNPSIFLDINGNPI